MIDDRSQLSPRGSVRGGRLCGASVTHRPPLTNHQQVRTPAQPDGKTLATEYMTGRTYTAITSACSYGGEETPLVFPLRLHSISEANSLQPGKINALKNTFLHFSVTSYDLLFANAAFGAACSRERGFHNGYILLCKKADFSCSNGLRSFALTKRLCYSAKRTCAGMTELM